jgi:hypothetical protein
MGEAPGGGPDSAESETGGVVGAGSATLVRPDSAGRTGSGRRQGRVSVIEPIMVQAKILF